MLDNLSITNRVRALGGLAVLGVAGVYAGTLVFETVQNNAFEEERAFKNAHSSSLALLASTLSLHKLESEFVLQRNEALITEFQFIEAQAKEQMRALEMETSEGAVDPIRRSFVSYVRAAEDVFNFQTQLGLSQDVGLEGELRASVHNAEEKLAEANQPELTIKMLMMRRHEKDFMMRIAPKYISRLDERVQEFKSIITASDISEAERVQILDNILFYQTKFHAWADARTQLTDASSQSAEIYTQLQAELEALAAQASLDAEQVIHDNHILMERARLIGTIALVLIGLLSLGFAIVIGRSISLPVGRMAKQMRELAESALGEDVGRLKLSDNKRTELHKMAQALNVFEQTIVEADILRSAKAAAEAEQEKQKLAETLAAEREQAEKAREAQNARVELEREREKKQIVAMLEKAVSGLITSVSQSSGELMSTAMSLEKMAQQADNQARGAAQEADSSAKLAAEASDSVFELGQAVKDILGQATRSQGTGQHAVNDAESLNGIMANVNAAVEEVGQVVSLINTIASQTNLLALNAAVEAARAGDAGRGFAVVAQEVQNLANQTTQSTSVVDEQIVRIRDAVGQLDRSVQGVSAQIRDMSENAGVICDKVHQQEQSTSDITQRVTESTQSSHTVKKVMTELSTTISNTGSSAQSVRQSAEQMSNKAEGLKQDMSAFFEHLRRA